MNLWRRMQHWLQALFRKAQLDREMDEEMRSHIELRTRANLEVGMSPGEARYAALRSFGGMEQVKEVCRDLRGVSWIETFWQDARFGVRMLKRNPAVAMTAVGSLALGVTLNSAIFSLVDGLWLRSTSNAVVFGTKPVTIPLRLKVGALAFLYGCHLPAERKGSFLERFKEEEAILGVPIGTLRVCYSDGTAANIEIRYGLNVLEWKLGDKLLPYCYGAADSLGASTASMRVRDAAGNNAFFYASSWGNPHLAKEIARIELISGGTEATPFLLALTAWPEQGE